MRLMKAFTNEEPNIKNRSMMFEIENFYGALFASQYDIKVQEDNRLLLIETDRAQLLFETTIISR